MKEPKGLLKVCSRGHQFSKTSDCPVCPICWPGYYKENSIDAFPKELPAPALRALLNAKITNLSQLASFNRLEIANLHGIGPNALSKLKKALNLKGLSFKN